MYLDERAREAIEEALRRGKTAVVQRRGDGCTVFEESKKIVYRTPDQ